MILPKLIGLYSPAPQCGKSTVATLLEKHYGYRRDRFARTMKAMIRTLLEEIGYGPDVALRMVDGDLKLEDIPVLGGHHTRHLMQTLGTEWGRKNVSETMWPDILMERWRSLNVATVIDDLRFPNEHEAMKQAGAFLVRIQRPGEQFQAPVGGHASDGALEWHDFHHVIHNDGSEAQLAHAVESMAESAQQFAISTRKGVTV
jgi:hypothetical protein